MRAGPAGKMMARAYHIRGLLKKYVIFCYFMFFCVSLPDLQGLAGRGRTSAWQDARRSCHGKGVNRGHGCGFHSWRARRLNLLIMTK